MTLEHLYSRDEMIECAARLFYIADNPSFDYKRGVCEFIAELTRDHANLREFAAIKVAKDIEQS